MTTTELDHLLRGQVGVVLGMLIMGVLAYFILKYLLNVAVKVTLTKFDEMIESNKQLTLSNERLTRTVANLLIASEIKMLKERGHEVIEELHAKP